MLERNVFRPVGVFEEKTARRPAAKPLEECPMCMRPERDLVLARSASVAVPGYGGAEGSANTTSAGTSQTRAALVREDKEVLLDATQPRPDLLRHDADSSQQRLFVFRPGRPELTSTRRDSASEATKEALLYLLVQTSLCPNVHKTKKYDKCLNIVVNMTNFADLKKMGFILALCLQPFALPAQYKSHALLDLPHFWKDVLEK